jgi:hypothetical protein
MEQSWERIGTLLASVGENTKAAAGSKAEARAEIEKVQNAAMRAGLDPTSPRWPHKELDELYRRAYGKPIDQSGAGTGDLEGSMRAAVLDFLDP